MIKKITFLIATMLTCFGVFSQQVIAQQNDESKDPTVVLMHTGTVTTCNALFYDSGGPTGNYSGNENHFLVLVPETQGARIKVTFEEFEVENNYDKLHVYNGSSPIDPLLATLTGANIPEDPFFADNPTGALMFNFTSDGSVHKAGWKATVECYTPVPNNLVAVRLNTSPHATAGVPKTIPFVVFNQGTAAVTGVQYTVQLQDASNNVLATSNGVDLASGAQTAIDLMWTPAAEGTIDVKGVVVFPADEAPGNNTTELVTFTVHPAGTYVVGIGPGTIVSGTRMPFDFYWKNSYAQTIYTNEQLGIGGGIINSLVYRYKFVSQEIGTKGVKVWIGETTQTNLDGGFINPSELTLVFDGDLDFPGGENELTINLQTPYMYNGGNLVIYSYRNLDTQYYNSSDLFYLVSTNENRSRHRQSDSQIDPLAPSSGTTKAYVPEVTMFFSTAGLGTIAGNVTCEGAPAGGVTVQIVDGTRKTTTDAAGNYALPYLVPGTYALDFIKFGYTDFNATNINVVGDETTTVNATISPIYQYMVSGTVTTSDTQQPVAGAVVNFYGYTDHTDTTDATGHYSMSGVWGGGKVYEVTVDAVEGYQAYSGTVTVNNQHITDHNIIVNEFAYPVNKVTATVEGENVNVTWIAPGTIPPYPPWISWCGKTDISNGIGAGINEITCAHRFTAEQLETIEVVGMSITKVRFNPHGTGTFKVRVWTGGSATEPGTLVHEQPVANVTLSQWNEVVLTTPVMIPDGQELWFGVHIVPDAVNYPGGVDAGPAITGFGDMTKIADQTWSTLTASGLSYNWALGALVDNGKGLVTNLSKLVAEYEMNSIKVTAINIPSEFRLTSAKESGEATVVENIENSASRAFVNYTLYRLVKGQPQADWTQLVAATTDTTYTDTGWGILPAGLYQYAVVANYTNGVASRPRLSNILAKDMEFEYTVNVKNNANEPVAGALVKLTNHDGNDNHAYEGTTGTTGVITFPTVWKGTYTITVTQNEHEPFADTVVISANATLPVELIEIIVTPFNLEIQQDGNDEIFSWNNTYGVTVILEAHDPWQDGTGHQLLLDADAVEYGQTIPIQGVMAGCDAPADLYDVFEYKIPENADPVCATTNVVIDGEDSVVIPAGVYDYVIVNPSSVGSVPNLWIAGPPNGRRDDYVFELGKIYRFTVGMGQHPDQVIIIITDEKTGKIVNIVRHGETVDEYSRFGEVASNQVSVVDNFEIGDYYYGAPSHTRAFLGYTVYLDGEEKASGIMETTYRFENVGGGNHTAGVKAVYTSGESEVAEIDFYLPPYWEVKFIAKRFSDGSPIRGVDIVISNESITESATTDINGIAIFELPSGTYNWLATKPGFETQEGTVIVTGHTEVFVYPPGIEDDTKVQGIKLYPNPATNTLTITRKNTINAMVEIYSNNGKTVSSFEMNEAIKEISVSKLNSGVYFIRVIENETITVQKFIKQ